MTPIHVRAAESEKHHTEVPVPAALPLFSLALFSLGLFKKRR
jgi:hypothetical protein